MLARYAEYLSHEISHANDVKNVDIGDGEFTMGIFE